MNLGKVPPGKYLVAVSGGVDSMVLLDILVHQPELDLVVAHFDHGIRQDSAEDQRLVAQAAQYYKLPYIYEEGHLSADVSEAQARQARYDFLERTREQSGAWAIITAHHQDDLIETMLINLLRGTNRKGLASLQSGRKLLRPLLKTGKGEVLEYARQHHIAWREDSTNHTDAYLRNRLRHAVLPKLSPDQRTQLLKINQTVAGLNNHIDQSVAELLQALAPADELQRSLFVMLPHTVAREIMAAWLRQNHVGNVSAKQIERLVAAVKTAQPGTVHNVENTKNMKVSLKFAQIMHVHASQRRS